MYQSRIQVAWSTKTRLVTVTFFLRNDADPNRIAKYCKIIGLAVQM